MSSNDVVSFNIWSDVQYLLSGIGQYTRHVAKYVFDENFNTIERRTIHSGINTEEVQQVILLVKETSPSPVARWKVQVVACEQVNLCKVDVCKLQSESVHVYLCG